MGYIFLKQMLKLSAAIRERWTKGIFLLYRLLVCVFIYLWFRIWNIKFQLRSIFLSHIKFIHLSFTYPFQMYQNKKNQNYFGFHSLYFLYSLCKFHFSYRKHVQYASSQFYSIYDICYWISVRLWSSISLQILSI